ncbi:HAMP domain-containing protein [Desulfovibrio sp. OttesenSCG-928-A18]|nr:HAMP domain-containing protein [Desulfovibrio sp. OttesenSCG-928-A18]
MFSSLNIQKKILIGLLVPALCLAVLTSFSYSNLLLIEKRMDVLGRIEGVERSVMELRRQGKFFLFYGKKEDYEAVLATTLAAEELLREVRLELLFSNSRSLVDVLAHSLSRYRESITEVRHHPENGRFPVNSRQLLKLKSEAHELSMTLEEQLLALSSAMRERIGHISEKLRTQLLAAALAVAALFALGAHFIRSQVLLPLKTIEETTRRIGEGDFTPVHLRRARDEIRELQEAFNRMVAELQSRQEQLVQSQKLSSIGTLSAGIAHQVNNPLNNISVTAQYLREKLKKSGRVEDCSALENIEKETGRARDIVRGLLDFSRRSEFRPRRIRLKTVVDNAVRFASTQLRPGVRIDCAVGGSLVLELDPQRISEALLNIIINSLQAIGPGPGEVRIRLGDEAPQGFVCLEIADNGPGIAPEDLSRIFDPFFTRKEEGQGTGLGLSITHGIIEECGGSIRAHSQPGRGARFVILFPIPGASVAHDRDKASGQERGA